MMNTIHSTETIFDAHIFNSVCITECYKKNRLCVCECLNNGMAQVIEELFSLGPIGEWSLIYLI